jgi:hypothetical protein
MGNTTLAEADIAQRIQRIEDTLAIQQLPIRYAMAVDSRDLDGWTELFVPDVQVGRHLSGRTALREVIAPRLREFYRSIHQIVGHRIELGDADHATGSVYCRAEHEVGSRWVVMAIRYDDEYRKVGGQWLFTRRREKHWYAADLVERPQEVAMNSWNPPAVTPQLPHESPSWAMFWAGADTAELTSLPVHE